MTPTFRSFLFIGGPPRSGTTLLTDIINESANIAVMAEYGLDELLMHIAPVFTYEAQLHQPDALHASTPDCGNAHEGADHTAVADTPSGSRYYTTQPLATFESSSAAPVLHHPIRYPTRAKTVEILSAIVRTSLEKPGAQVLGSKNPIFMLTDQHEQVAALGHPCKYLFILRNPLHTLNSAINRRNRSRAGIDNWVIDDVDQIIDQHLLSVSRIIALIRAKAPEDCFIVKYDDLVSDQEATVRSIFGFLNLPFESLPLLADQHRGKNPVCTKQEIERIHQRLKEAIDCWDDLHLTGLGRDALPCLSRMMPPFKTCNIQLGPTDIFRYLGTGWSTPEAEGTWSMSAYASIILPPHQTEASTILLDARCLVASPEKPVHVEVHVNGLLKYAKTWLLAQGRALGNSDTELIAMHEPVTLCLEHVSLNKVEANIIEFRFSGITSPQAAGLGPDPRDLCLYLRGIRIHAE